MFIEGIIEVAIGLIFAWLVISIATIQIQEWISSNILEWRAKDMETAIRNMLGKREWAEQLAEHPIIKGLSKTGKMPSYIPADKFALALFDIIMTAGTEGSKIQRTLFIAKNEVDQAPRALFPLIGHIFSRWGNEIKEAVIRLLNYLIDAKIVTMASKYRELIELSQNITTSEDAMRSFLGRLVADEYIQTRRTSADGKPIKQLQFSAQAFIAWYPKLDDLVFDIYVDIYEQFRSKQALPGAIHFNKTQKKEYISWLRAALEHKTGNDFTLNLLDIFPFDDKSLAPLEQIRSGYKELHKSNPMLYRALQAITRIGQSTSLMDTAYIVVDKAGTAIDLHEKQLAGMRLEAETWFNDVMDRIQGWYKRKAQALAFVIGLLVALIMNVDSIDLANQLWRDPELRNSYTTFVSEYVKERATEDSLKNDDLKKIQADLEKIKVPFGWDLQSWPAIAATPTPGNDGKPKRQTLALVCPTITPTPTQQSTATPDPLSPNSAESVSTTNTAPKQIGNQCYYISNLPKSSSAWWLKVLGIMISAGAAMQGAPFWFDILKKVVNMRSTGTNPAEKQKEEKDKAAEAA